MTFTTKNVQRAVREVKDTYKLGNYLGVPYTKQIEICEQFSTVPQQMKAYIHYFMEHDPVASWRAVIVALDTIGETKAADAIRHLAEPVTGRAGSTTCTHVYIACCSVCHARPTLLLTRVLTAHESASLPPTLHSTPFLYVAYMYPMWVANVCIPHLSSSLCRPHTHHQQPASGYSIS